MGTLVRPLGRMHGVPPKQDRSEAKYGLVIVVVKIQRYMYEKIYSKEKMLWNKEAR